MALGERSLADNLLTQIGGIAYLLSRFVGMLTDSRSFLSYSRHEYFRRLLCNLLGEDVRRGRLPDDRRLLGDLVRDVCFANARRYFPFANAIGIGFGPMAQQAKTSAGQVITLVVIAVILGIAYVALEFYTEGEKYRTMAESRGTQISQALSKHRLETKAYPASLDALAPKYIQTMPKCPGGEAFAYQASGDDYTLRCDKVAWKSKPYTYNSKARTWSD